MTADYFVGVVCVLCLE